jgi:Flp pilus assembly protein TadG
MIRTLRANWARSRRRTGIEISVSQRERGQSILETALVLPLLLFLLAIVVDAARAFDAYIVLTNAVREGARFATLEPSPDPAAIERMVVTDVVGSGTNITHMADFSEDKVTVITGTQAITVTAVYTFDLWFGGVLGMPTFTLSKSAAMPVFPGLEEE